MAKPVVVAETPQFIRQASEIWSDDEREKFVDLIARNPTEGDVIPETGGVRKLRWSREGSGKRGGVRVIYFYYNPGHPLYLLMAYAKARQENLTADEKRKIRNFVAVIKNQKELRQWASLLMNCWRVSRRPPLMQAAARSAGCA